MPGMLVPELTQAAIFIACVAAFYSLAGAVLVRRLLRRPRVGTGIPARPYQAQGAGRLKLWFGRIILTLTAIGTLCIAYGFIEPYRLAVTRLSVASSKLVAGSRPIRIVHISDLHSDPSPRLEERLPEAIAREKPDVIAFTGDSLNSAAALPVFRRCMARLAAIAPTFAVRGNWDLDYWARLDLFGGTGVRELNGQAIKLRIGGRELWVAGIALTGSAAFAQTLRRVPTGALTVVLYHGADEIEEAADRNVDLYLAGHTHGGQVALPFYGPLITMSPVGDRYPRASTRCRTPGFM